MRSFLTYGLISLGAVAALYACSDDSGDGGTSTGGTSSVGGSAGVGGGGAAGNAGNAGVGGGGASGGGAGGAGPVAPAANCTQCVQLTTPIPATPLDATGMRSQATYVFSAPPAGPPFDLTNVTSITWRVKALTPNANYYVQPFLQNRPPEDSSYKGDYGEMMVTLAPDRFTADAWVDILVNVAAQPGPAAPVGGDAGADAGADAGDAGGAAPPGGALAAFDKSKTRFIGLYVGAVAAAHPGLVSVEIDSVTVVGTSTFTTQTFDTGVGGLTINTDYQSPPGAVAPAFH
jgi:hypothetical protein